MVRRIYDVRNLTAGGGDFPVTSGSWDDLIETITSTVAPETWSGNGGPGLLSVVDGKLVVLQSEAVQSQIGDVLSALETLRRVDPTAREGDEAPIIRLPLPTPLGARIEQALDTRIDFGFHNNPLKDVIGALQSQLHINIQADTKALADAGVTNDAEFSLDLRQVTAEFGLHQMLVEKDLGFIIDRDVLLITTADVAKTKKEIVVYPVGDLVYGDDSDTTGRADYDSLIETITSVVAPSSWDAGTGPGQIAVLADCNALVFNQTDDGPSAG